MAYIRSKVVGEEMHYLLLDEIQMLDCFEAVLNGYLRKDNMDVFVTGSNAKLLSKDIATEFAGRGDEIHMYPLSFAEFMTIYSGDKYMGLYLNICYMAVFLWLFFVREQTIRQLHCRICSMRFIFEILPNVTE